MKKLYLGLSISILIGLASATPQAARPQHEGLIEAKRLLREGTNSWDGAKLREARDRFLGLLVRKDDQASYLQYYIALSDYRLAAFSMTEQAMDEADRYTAEGVNYLEKLMAEQPEWGEPYAMYAVMLGFQIAFHQEKAMEYAFRIEDAFTKAFAREPDNPRVNLVKGVSVFFTPETYGGGAKRAVESLEKAVAAFEREAPAGPEQPRWGKDEALTYLGMAHIQLGDTEKGAACLKKALEANPDFGLAADELRKLETKKR